jgi:hypothetical protein
MKAEKADLIESLMNEVIEPGIARLLETRYFADCGRGRSPKSVFRAGPCSISSRFAIAQ